MNIHLFFLSFLFVFVVSFEDTHSQDKRATSAFKISGSKKIIDSQGQKVVEYCTESPEHLFILDYNQEGQLLSKTSFHFKGNEFLLKNMDDYVKDQQLMRDGKHVNYGDLKKVTSELTYVYGKVDNATTFYENGNRKLYLEGDAATLNGEYKMWYPDGKLSFSGNYRNNLKHGEFESFALDGKSIRRGTYDVGKLISGVSVVQDLIYEKPEEPAEFPGGLDALNNYLKSKTSQLDFVTKLREDDIIHIGVQLTIDYMGTVSKLEYTTMSIPEERMVVDWAFKNFPDFVPALIEKSPVSSIRRLDLFLSKNGLGMDIAVAPEIDSITNVNADSIVTHFPLMLERIPDFPGGQMALRKHIAQVIRYPVYAQEHGIQGKVLVSFIVNENGAISNVRIAKSVHPTLDAEAMHVVRSMPNWEPGYMGGKAVKVLYTVPINFVLQ